MTACMTRRTDGQNDDKLQFGIDFNKTRDSLGVPKIETDWVIQENSPTYYYWAKPDDRVTTFDAFHLKKESYLINNELSMEEDQYHYQISDTLGYRLVYNYNFDSSDWRCSLVKYQREKYLTADRIKLRLEQADSVLKNWGLRR
jgi:hypothetical protein